MVNKNRIGKVAGMTVAAGVLAVAGLGAGTASADDGGSAPGSAPNAQRMRKDERPPQRPQQGGPMQGAGVRPGGAGQQGGPNANRPAMQQPGVRPAQAAGAANTQA